MNKVICDVCGTSYPENSSQCPICGFARSSDDTLSLDNEQASYTHVKGGRFSKSNVRKRNHANQRQLDNEVAPRAKQTKAKEEKSNTGLVVVIILLLLAIIAVVGYIAVRFFMPDSTIQNLLANIGLPGSSQVDEPTETEQTQPTEDPFACKSITLNQYEVTLEPNTTYPISVTCDPVDTTDPLTFVSSNEAVASVDASGMIITYTEGTATITVSCGNVSKDIEITCVASATEPEVTEPETDESDATLPEDEAVEQVSLTLNRKEITFDIDGQTWLLYDGNIAVSDITWSSDDNNVATILDGKVTAVGKGDTTVHASYNGSTTSCLIHCNFDEVEETEGKITEAGSTSKRKYKLYNPTGYADDVTIRVGQTFTLKLVDENKKEVTDATWEVEDPDYCSYSDNTVKGLASGTTKVKATYEGVTYSCIVRVVKK